MIIHSGKYLLVPIHMAAPGLHFVCARLWIPKCFSEQEPIRAHVYTVPHNYTVRLGYRGQDVAKGRNVLPSATRFTLGSGSLVFPFSTRERLV